MPSNITARRAATVPVTVASTSPVRPRATLIPLGPTSTSNASAPTRRRIHIRQEDRTPDLSWTPITLDLADVRIR
ncbi:hypothetical protein GCM10011576_12820 [Micromonospora parathelypteridis]|nr:hypothetical protein GCM10011576_12820 [Micromonospora parathelypteridis]